MINTNLLNIETNFISPKSEVNKTLQKKIPDWALYFEWIVSDWNVNRNWYAINSDAWFFDKEKYVKDFLKTWTILYNHNPEQPIGRPMTFEKCKDKIKVSWYVFDDYYTNWAIWRWLILWLSTWHITHEQVYRNKKGKCYSEDEFNSLNRTTLEAERPFTVVVNKAEIVEFSFVTTRSNRASVLTNSVETLAKNLNMSTNDVETLFLNNDTMPWEEKKEVTTETPVDTSPEVIWQEDVVTWEANSVKEEEVKEVETTEKVTEDEVSEAPTETNSIELTTLNNSLIELQKNFEEYKKEATLEIETLKQNNEVLKWEVAKYQEMLKADIKENAPRIVSSNSTDLKSINDFKDKYSKY